MCNDCLAKIPPAVNGSNDFIVSIFDYDNKIIKQAIWLLKYSGEMVLAKDLAKSIYEHLVAELEDRIVFENFTDPILVPIPLSKKRFRERGYNQSGLLIKELLKLDQGRNFKIYPRALKKIKHTPPQAKIINKEERLKNLEDCFAVTKPELIKDRNIVLVDDVSTTGATLSEARRALRRAGARKVFAITLAH